MLKQSARLEVKREDRIYQLNLPDNCPLGEVHDVLYEMRCYIIARINEHQKADQPREPEQPKESEQPKSE